jgi:hypothetical protein
MNLHGGTPYNGTTKNGLKQINRMKKLSQKETNKASFFVLSA